MKQIISYTLVFTLGALIGITYNTVGATENTPKPAFLIVSSERIAGVTQEDYGPYLAAAGPLARNAGLSMLASAQEPLLLEGQWPYKNVAIERFESMQAVKDFWYSNGYQAAKKLREGLSKINFIIAIEGD